MRLSVEKKKRKTRKEKRKEGEKERKKKKRNLGQEDLVNEHSKCPPIDCSPVVLLTKNLRSHELRRPTEGVRRLSKSHVLLAQTIISDLDVPINVHQNVIQLQVTEEGKERTLLTSRCSVRIPPLFFFSFTYR